MDRTVILILQLLAFGRLRAEQGAARADQVRPQQEQAPVDQKILLLAPRIGVHLLLGLAEQREDTPRVAVDRLHRAQQRRLLVERVAGRRAERAGDKERAAAGRLENVGGTRHVPRRVAARFKGRAQAAGGQAGAVGLAADKLLGRELGDGAAVRVRLQKAIVFFRRQAGERIKDMGVVRGPVLDRPVAHGLGHRARDRHIEPLAEIDRAPNREINLFRQALPHHDVAEDTASERLLGGAEGIGFRAREARQRGGDRLDGGVSCIHFGQAFSRIRCVAAGADPAPSRFQGR